MSTKIKYYDKGDCVEVSTWEGSPADGFFHSVQMVGLVLEAELVDMDLQRDGQFKTTQEWMYRILLPNGIVTEAWDYEIRPVNVMGKEYNNSSRKPKGA